MPINVLGLIKVWLKGCWYKRSFSTYGDKPKPRIKKKYPWVADLPSLSNIGTSSIFVVYSDSCDTIVAFESAWWLLMTRWQFGAKTPWPRRLGRHMPGVPHRDVMACTGSIRQDSQVIFFREIVFVWHAECSMVYHNRLQISLSHRVYSFGH